MGLELPDWVVRKFRDWGLGTKALLLFPTIVVITVMMVISFIMVTVTGEMTVVLTVVVCCGVVLPSFCCPVQFSTSQLLFNLPQCTYRTAEWP